MKSSSHINELKASLSLKDAVLASLHGEAEKQRKELEMVIFDSCRGFVKEIVKILDEEVGK